jgi:hypothetical protein
MTAWRCRELADVVDLHARRALAEFAVPGEEPTAGHRLRDRRGPAPAHMGADMQARRDTAELTLALADRGVC